jgi:hypothetical protein
METIDFSPSHLIADIIKPREVHVASNLERDFDRTATDLAPAKVTSKDVKTWQRIIPRGLRIITRKAKGFMNIISMLATCCCCWTLGVRSRIAAGDFLYFDEPLRAR